jgi:glucose-6-phosphate 1-epimerase
MTIAQLNADYAIDGQLQFIEGSGGFPLIEIDNGQAKATISVYAGHILAFQPKDEPVGLIFLSAHTAYQSGKAIRGGIPICWPWFGADPENQGRPNHGFVRNRLWQVSSTEARSDGSTQVMLGIVDTDATQALWPYAFNLAIVITVGHTLKVELITRNTGDQPFTITQALHSYFTVGDISQTKVIGLAGTNYRDKVAGYAQKTQTGDITIAEEVDRIYQNVPPCLTIEDAALGRKIQIISTGSSTAIVWNPWSEIAANMADLGDDEYQRFVCVETANAAEEVIEVAAGDESCLGMTVAVER